ncbi:MAG: hypothetical protein KJZ78_05055 [Bryobacteraceae bacterium]|nr:hypothetical protein [Bryobacteraceae bacterium]
MNKLLTPNEQLPGLEGVTIGDFWSWAYSDLMSNTVRPLFAEFLVGKCLGLVDKPRKEWDHVDFLYGGKKVEVKSSAYVQTWIQTTASVIMFDIAAKARPWLAETNSYGPSGRSADCYVLCVHTDVDRSTCQVIDTGRWDFYVLPSDVIARTFGSQKSVRLSRIQRLCSPVKYSGLKHAINVVLFGASEVIPASESTPSK